MTLPAVSALTAALHALEGAPLRVADYQVAALSSLVEVARLAASLKQAAEAHLATAAGEITRRDDLPRTTGARTTEELLKSSGLTGRDASTAVRIGRLTQRNGLE